MSSSNAPAASKAIALYHVIRKSESLSSGSTHILGLIQKAQRDYPGRRRDLFLDIEGHCARDGDFSPETKAFIADIVMDFFGQFISRLHIVGLAIAPPGPQRDDIPDRTPDQGRSAAP